MSEALWLAGFLAANLWGGGSVNVPDGGAVIIGAMEFTAEVRTEYGPPTLSRIPYVNRLFRTVGWSRMSAAVLPPLQPGEEPRCEEPTREEILSALPTPACPFCKQSRDVTEVRLEKLVDRIDPPRFFPLIGPAQLHHVHWKCTVSFTETTDATWPCTYHSTRLGREVVYIDKDRLHLYVATPADGEAQEARCCPAGGCGACPCKPAARVVACWEKTERDIQASVYLFNAKTGKTITAAGVIEVQAFDMAAALKGEQPQAVGSWRFDACELENRMRTDRIGAGYTLSLPLNGIASTVEHLKLQIAYVPQDGVKCSDAPTYLALRPKSDPLVAQAKSKVVQAQAVSRKIESRQVSIADIVKMTKAGLSDAVIVRQLELTGSKFDLSVQDLIELKSQGVSDLVIRQMQDLRLEQSKSDVNRELFSFWVSTCK